MSSLMIYVKCGDPTPLLLLEANSKENLLWWFDYFEKQNKKSLKSPGSR